MCLFPEPCALGVGSVFFERVKLDGCISHCAGGGGGGGMLKEKSVLAKGGKTQLAHGTSAGPSHASRDGAETCLCQEACHDSPVAERQTLKATDGKRWRGNF